MDRHLKKKKKILTLKKLKNYISVNLFGEIEL